MKFKVLKLVLHCKESDEELDLSHHISFFYGPIATGKSTIVRLIDYCLGGDFPDTLALKNELLSLELKAIIGENEILFERVKGDNNNIEVTWIESDGEKYYLRVPIRPVENPLIPPDIYCFSDLMFKFMGLPPIKMPVNTQFSDSGLRRLSFRDIFWYCYLDQREIDSSFFNLYEESHKMKKSRDVLSFVFGFYTERLNELKAKYEDEDKQAKEEISEANKISEFLHRFGPVGDNTIDSEIAKHEKSIQEFEQQKQEIGDVFSITTNFADSLRVELKNTNTKINELTDTIQSLTDRNKKYVSLRAELISAKVKVLKIDSVRDIFSDVNFEKCPACGQDIVDHEHRKPGECNLCGQTISIKNKHDPSEIMAERVEFENRVSELQELISTHQKYIKKFSGQLTEEMQKKKKLEVSLSSALRDYYASISSEVSGIASKIATLKEKIRNLERTAEIHNHIEALIASASRHNEEKEKIMLQIKDENDRLEKAGDNIRMLEKNFLEGLKEIRFDSLSPDARVNIDSVKWRPSVETSGKEKDLLDFKNIGSGGEYTLFTVCYALAIHKTAVSAGSPLPSLIILDTPMKSIDPSENVNRDLLIAFHNYLYRIASEELKDTQIIIIENEFLKDPRNMVDVYSRKMTKDDPNFPPLISYYRGD